VIVTHIPRSEILESQQHQVLIELSPSPNSFQIKKCEFDIQQKSGIIGKAIAQNRGPNSSNLLFTYLSEGKNEMYLPGSYAVGTFIS